MFRTNRIESNWVRFEFDSTESRIKFKRFGFERIEFDSIRIRFGFDSIPWLSRDVTQISKKGNFCFRENWKVALHKVTQISKKGNLFANHLAIRFDSIQIRFDLTQFDSIQTESNFINSDSIHKSQIRIESESNPNLNLNLIRFNESFAEP